MTRRQGRDERRAEITEAAIRVLQREGAARLTARKVATEAGLALGHITYNFTSMDELLSEAYRLASERLRTATEVALLSEGDAMARIRAFLRAGFSVDFLHPAHLRMRIELWSAALWHQDIAATEAQLYARYRLALLGLLVPFGGTAAAREQVADTVMAALDGLWLDYMRRRDPAALERGLLGCEDLVRLSLGQEESAAHAEGRDPSPR